MNANQFRVGQLVCAADADAMTSLCPTYSRNTVHGVIVDNTVDAGRHRVAVKWIDYRGPQQETYPLDPSLLRIGSLTGATRTRVCPARRPATPRTSTSSPRFPLHGAPSIEIRQLKIYANGTRDTATRLHFHTVDDANIALHAIADAQLGSRRVHRRGLLAYAHRPLSARLVRPHTRTPGGGQPSTIPCLIGERLSVVGGVSYSRMYVRRR